MSRSESPAVRSLQRRAGRYGHRGHAADAAGYVMENFLLPRNVPPVGAAAQVTLDAHNGLISADHTTFQAGRVAARGPFHFDDSTKIGGSHSLGGDDDLLGLLS